jgi:hypothetical protein
MFNTESFRVASRHFNLVAFAVDVGLLLKVLKSAVTNAPDTLDVKLTQCAVAVPGCEEVENKPFLCFTARVSSTAAAAAWARRCACRRLCTRQCPCRVRLGYGYIPPCRATYACLLRVQRISKSAAAPA